MNPHQPLASRYLKLPFAFDVPRMQAELAALEASHWVAHFNTGAYDNGWACMPLRAIEGRLDHIIPLESSRFEDTVLLQQCPYFRHIIDSFECEKTSVRLMALDAGARIKPHRDSGASLEDGVTRLHIPIHTSAQTLFTIDGEDVHFSAGDTWYLNASCEHAVYNGGTVARVHLMLDCVSNPWLEAVFVRSGWVARAPSKYADAAIQDGNVDEVIVLLRAAGTPAGLALADQLQAQASTVPVGMSSPIPLDA